MYVCGRRLLLFLGAQSMLGQQGSVSLTSPSGACLELTQSRFAVCVSWRQNPSGCDCPWNTTSSFAFSFSPSLFHSLSIHTNLHLSWLFSVAKQHLSIMYSLYSQQKAQRMAPLISIRHLVLCSFSFTGTATHTVCLSPPPLSDADYRLCVVLSVHGQDCSSRCVQCLCASVVSLYVCVWGYMWRGGCVCVHMLKLVLVDAGGVAYGCRVGWALLCTPGVKWTV